jgi:AAA domain
VRIHLTQVMIETVDSFQGKQLDVVILSCVRASAESGGRRSVGFVSDLRRLNVVRGPHAACGARSKKPALLPSLCQQCPWCFPTLQIQMPRFTPSF